MKNNLSFLLSVATFFCCTLAHAEEIEIPVETLLAPTHGYEEKNTTQVVVYGILPNTCYTLAEPRVERDLDRKIVKIQQFATRDRTGVCANDMDLPLQMLARSPFTNEISVGKLAVGDFTFLYNKEGGSVGSRTITISPNKTPTIDSLPYAAVSSESIPDIINGIDEVRVTLHGVLTSTCSELEQEVKVIQEEDVFVLLPTVKMKKGMFCTEVLTPFTKIVNLGRVSPGRYLIHTRSMSGRALNKVIRVAR